MWNAYDRPHISHSSRPVYKFSIYSFVVQNSLMKFINLSLCRIPYIISMTRGLIWWASDAISIVLKLFLCITDSYDAIVSFVVADVSYYFPRMVLPIYSYAFVCFFVREPSVWWFSLHTLLLLPMQAVTFLKLKIHFITFSGRTHSHECKTHTNLCSFF